MSKRIISLILSLFLTLNIALVSVSAQTDYFVEVDGTIYEEAVYLLNALGIIESGKDGAYELNANITRAEFCAILSKTMGADFASRSFGAHTFSDVPDTHWAVGYIETLAAMGIVSGHGNGLFEPDEYVLYEEAVKMIVDMLGYTPLAVQGGGYPNGYIKCATDIKLLSGANVYYGYPIKNGTLAQLVYNALTIDVMKPLYIESTAYTIKEDETLLSSVFKIENNYGYVTSTYQTGLSGKGMVEIDGKLFEVGNTNVESFLGRKIEYYAQENKTIPEKTLVYVKALDNNDMFTVEAADIISVNGLGTDDAVITYYASHLSVPKSKELALSKDLRVIYNNKEKKPVTEKMLQPICGSVEFLDSQNDGVYDFAFVTEYDRRIVRDVNYYDNTLYFTDGTSIALDDNKKITIEKNGKKADINDITIDGVLNIVQSEDEKILEIYITDKMITGQITATTGDAVVIGGEEYRIDPEAMYISGYTVGLSDYANFYLDIMGNIYYYKPVDDTYEKYGYLVKIGADTSELDPEVSVQLCIEDKKFSIFKLASKIKLNGKNVESEKLLTNPRFVDQNLPTENKTVKQLIVYKTNAKDEIEMIDTWMDLQYSTEPSKDMGYDINNFTRVAPVPAGYEPWWQVPESYSYNEYYGNPLPGSIWMNNVGLGYFGQKYNILPTTFVIKAPVGMYEEEETAYSVAYGNAGRALINKNNAYVPNLELYDANETFGLGAVVQKGNWSPADTIGTNNQIVLITKISHSLDDEGNPVYKISGLFNNKTVEYYSNEKTNDTFMHLKAGDAVQVALNGSEVLAVRVIFTGMGTENFYQEDVYARVRYYGDTLDKIPPQHPANPIEYKFGEYLSPVHIGSICSVSYGELVDVSKEKQTILLYTGGDREKGTRAYQLGGRIYVYDTKKETAYVGTASDFNVNEPLKIMVRLNNYGSQEFVIYK